MHSLTLILEKVSVKFFVHVNKYFRKWPAVNIIIYTLRSG